MQRIDLEEVHKRIPAEWYQKAKEAMDDVVQSTDEADRSHRINAHDDVWQQVKQILLQVSDGKCWYCESKEVRSDRNVDHFRPKNNVYKCPGHHGYWWLAFQWHNYRLSCTFCNSRRKDQNTDQAGGKGDRFPLLDENERAYTPNDDIQRERPSLLDPTTHGDPSLLKFLPDGTVVPKYDKATHPVHYERARCSIELYHLYHTEIKERRQELYNYISQLADDGDMFFIRWSCGDNTAYHALEGVLRQLHEIVQKHSEYSGAARSMIMSLSTNHDWITAVLQGI